MVYSSISAIRPSSAGSFRARPTLTATGPTIRRLGSGCRATLSAAKGVLPLRPYFETGSEINANGWTDRGTAGYRLDLLRLRNGQPRHAGLYDSRVTFKKRDSLFVPVVTIIESPMIGLVQSEHPDWVVVSFGADRVCRAVVEVQGVASFVSPVESERHEVRIDGLKPSQKYRYRVVAIEGTDTSATSWFTFHTAPAKGAGLVVFAYTGGQPHLVRRRRV